MKKSERVVQTVPAIQVIERIYALMDVMAQRQDAVSLGELSEKTGLHPSTAHRILNDLVMGRYVDRPEAGSYRLGMRLLELGNLVKGRLSVRDAALPLMRELHKLTQHLDREVVGLVPLGCVRCERFGRELRHHLDEGRLIFCDRIHRDLSTVAPPRWGTRVYNTRTSY